jgi:hypothetical protein
VSDNSQDGHDTATARSAYLRDLLDSYLATPGVFPRIRPADRQLAEQLYEHRVPLPAIRTAFLLGAARRLKNNAFATPLPPIRSLHYFTILIREVRERPLGYRDVDDLRNVLREHGFPC